MLATILSLSAVPALIGFAGIVIGAAYRAGQRSVVASVPVAIPVARPVVKPVAILYPGPNRRPCKLYR